MAGPGVILLGPPGAGKSTQASWISRDYRLAPVSTGDMLREAAQSGSGAGSLARPFMEAGELVPDQIVTGIVADRLRQPDVQQGFLLDGFPRTVGQAEELDRQLKEQGRQIEAVLAIGVAEAELLQRLTGRLQCRNCARIYAAPAPEAGPEEVERRCRECGGELYRRSDDTEATVRRRLAVYRSQTEPLLEYYSKRGVLDEIDGSGGADEIYQRIRATLGERLRRG